jgi:CDP-diacylglycerol---serine O-phosphatidyltransferase
VIFDHYSVRIGTEVKPLIVLIITLTLSFLMVSTIKYRSFKDMKFRGRQHITYLVWGILALMLIAAWPQVMLFVIFAGYALLGPAERLVGLLSKVAGKRPSPKTEQSVTESKL